MSPFEWFKWARDLRGPKGWPKAVLIQMCGRLNGERDRTWESAAAIAEDLGVNERTVRRAFVTLAEMGVIEHVDNVTSGAKVVKVWRVRSDWTASERRTESPHDGQAVRRTESPPDRESERRTESPAATDRESAKESKEESKEESISESGSPPDEKKKSLDLTAEEMAAIGIVLRLLPWWRWQPGDRQPKKSKVRQPRLGGNGLSNKVLAAMRRDGVDEVVRRVRWLVLAREQRDASLRTSAGRVALLRGRHEQTDHDAEGNPATHREAVFREAAAERYDHLAEAWELAIEEGRAVPRIPDPLGEQQAPPEAPDCGVWDELMAERRWSNPQPRNWPALDPAKLQQGRWRLAADDREHWRRVEALNAAGGWKAWVGATNNPAPFRAAFLAAYAKQEAA
jgi:hypothetical protein